MSKYWFEDVFNISGSVIQEFEKEDIYFSKVEEDMFDLVHKGNDGAVCSRIKNGTSVNLRNDKNQTLLHYAVLYNQVKITKLLISLGANLDAKDKFEQTAREVIKELNPELYSQIDGLLKDFSQTQMEQKVLETQVLGSSEEDSCCIIF